MTDIVVDTLRLRGWHARRLARVAARALPAALERALADVGDVEIAGVHVVLDLDPDEHDDETLAVLWADLIRASLVGRETPTTAEQRSAAAGGSSTPTEGPAVDPDAIARAWLSLPESARTSVPAALLLVLGDQPGAVRVASALGPTEWRRLVAALRQVLPGLAEEDAATEPLPAGEASASGPWSAVVTGDAVTDETGTPPGNDGDSLPDAASVTAATAEVQRAADLVAVLDSLRELHAGTMTPLDPAAVTRFAGLVLLYPWLADHCRFAEELHPGLDQYDVREAALAAVVADPSAADDPLVRLLAGQVGEPEVRERSPLPRQDEVDRSAERVVASFAALLPGFERSTPGFVRDAWLLRLGVLDTERAPMMLTAATHPLDVLLPLLPYPMGLFKLPWSPALTVRFRP